MKEVKQESPKAEERVSWTREQQKVISLRNRNILVSAAAGSGKTAVLVERIITMITEGENPVDIDKLLIVTFTNAAAAEMRERIGAAIEKKILEQPDHVHLQKQMTLIHSAQITTIHSFCLQVIRNHFNSIDLDPSFRIGDEAELKLLRGDVIAQLLEKKYEGAEEAFLEFVECYATGKTDAGIEEMVLQLYHFSMSYPWPMKWLEECRKAFEVESVEEMQRTAWMKSLSDYICAILEDTLEKNKEALAVCNEPDGPCFYQDALLADQELLEQLAAKKDYLKWQESFSSIAWKRLSPKKDSSICEEKRELVKAIREGIKKAVGDLKKQFFFQPAEDMWKDIKGVEAAMNALLDLTIAFAEAYKREKEEKRIVDFHDLEHFALQILVKEEDGQLVYTEVAKDYSEEFVELLVDEYQDSNLVQETILNSISKEKFGSPNVFMVGDVKQSIYKFRLAKPELFMAKYDTYSLEDNSHQRIDLHKNFRSRAVVLEGINFIFEQIMHKSLGNIEYDTKAALYPGANFLEGKGYNISENNELLLVSAEEGAALKTEESEGTKKEQETLSEEEIEYSAKELEARAVAKRIKELVNSQNGLCVVDKESKKYRICRYGDIVILLRTMTNWAEIFAETLMAEGIMAYTDTQSGYFSALEIKTVLNYLKIIDNPRQDIPLTAVMRSAIGDFKSKELAVIRSRFSDCEMYEAVKAYAEAEEDYEEGSFEKQLSQKTKAFLTQLEYFREMVSYTSIHKLLERILDETKYYDYVSVMPGGQRRKDNLNMLLQKAVDFENSSYAGLFHFNRYIEKLHKYEVDFGEAGSVEGNENAVRIMSIHKSKGLEFPVVFVSGMGKTFNNQDSKSKLVIHPDLGIGPDFIDYKKRVKAPTLLKKAIQKQTVLENLGEELRVLYVALTRAKEKLIMTGYVKKFEDQMKKWSRKINGGSKPMGYYELASANQYLDWIVPALFGKEESLFDIRVIGLEELTQEETREQLMTGIRKEELLHWNAKESYSEKFHDFLKERTQYVYPFAGERNLKSKMTVSELKRAAYLEEEEIPELWHESRDIQRNEEATAFMAEKEVKEEIPLPKFLQENEEITGANLGTLYHKIFENIKLSDIKTEEDVKIKLQQIVADKKMTKEEASLLSIRKIYQFAISDIGKRIQKAEVENKIWKEQPFVIGIPANEIDCQQTSEELILVQGIIDIYFQEADGFVLLDYKTDQVRKEDGEEILKQRYEAQLNYYQRAIEQLTGERVKEKIIYSLGLGKSIFLCL